MSSAAAAGDASAAAGAGGEELDMVVDERGRAAESFITMVGQLRQKERQSEQDGSLS